MELLPPIFHIQKFIVSLFEIYEPRFILAFLEPLTVHYKVFRKCGSMLFFSTRQCNESQCFQYFSKIPFISRPFSRVFCWEIRIFVYTATSIDSLKDISKYKYSMRRRTENIQSELQYKNIYNIPTFARTGSYIDCVLKLKWGNL